MLRTISSLKGHAIHTSDGELGHVAKLYIDEEQWGVRYLVVETGMWLFKKSVLLSPYSITGINEAAEAIEVSLSRDQIKNAPEVDTNARMTRHAESEYSRYYGYDTYWTGPNLWGLETYPIMRPATDSAPLGQPSGDGSSAELIEDDLRSHLRDSEEITGYEIQGSDDDIGHVEDFIFDDKTWTVHYLIVDTRNWWPGGKKVLVAVRWIDHINWMDESVRVNLTREQIKNSPEYDSDRELSRDYETELHRYYGRDTYWD